jgi:hypothetical protein
MVMRLERHKRAAAQHGHAADGAVRPQDRGFFESWNLPDRVPDLVVRRR